MVKLNGLYVPVTLANAINNTNAIAQAFTNGIAANASVAAVAAVAAPANAPTTPSKNRTHYMLLCVQAGLTNAQAVAAVQARYGANVPTNAASINWCRQAIKQWQAGKTTAQAKVAARMLAS